MNKMFMGVEPTDINPRDQTATMSFVQCSSNSPGKKWAI